MQWSFLLPSSNKITVGSVSLCSIFVRFNHLNLPWNFPRLFVTRAFKGLHSPTILCSCSFYLSKSIIWHSLSIVHWGISKTVLEAFWTWPGGSIFTASEFRITIRFSVARCSGFVFLFIFFDGQSRLFSFSDSNTYLDTEICIISLRFGGLEITLVWFSPLFTRVSLCLHFTILSLTMARGAIFKILFFASV